MAILSAHSLTEPPDLTKSARSPIFRAPVRVKPRLKLVLVGGAASIFAASSGRAAARWKDAAFANRRASVSTNDRISGSYLTHARQSPA